MNYKLIIFDMDGTFVDSRRFHAKIFFGFFQKYYHYISYETCYELVGRTVKKIFSDCGIAQEDQGRYFELLDIYYEHEGAKLAAVTGIPEGFTELLSWLQREKCRTAVVTNSLNRGVEKILDCHGLWNLFDRKVQKTYPRIRLFPKRCADGGRYRGGYHPGKFSGSGRLLRENRNWLVSG